MLSLPVLSRAGEDGAQVFSIFLKTFSVSGPAQNGKLITLTKLQRFICRARKILLAPDDPPVMEYPCFERDIHISNQGASARIECFWV